MAIFLFAKVISDKYTQILLGLIPQVLNVQNSIFNKKARQIGLFIAYSNNEA